MATGDHPGTWGTEVNTAVFTVMDLNLGGRFTANVAGNSNVTITNSNAQNLYHTLSGALTGSIQYILPTLGGFYLINNQSSGAFTITVIMASGTGVIIPQGSTALVFANPDTPAVTIPENYLSSLILGSPLGYASGGTNAITAAAAMANLGATVTLTAGAGLTGGGNLGSNLSLAFAQVADSSILANITGGSAVPSANTLSNILDHILGTAQGSIIYRSGTGWTLLGPGTNGQFFQTAGAGANPLWATFSTNILTLTAQSGTPSTPAAGFGILYEKTDKNPYFMSDAGGDQQILTKTFVASSSIATQNTAKAFAMFTQSGTTVTFTAGNWFNVASVTRTGPGIYTIVFTNNLPTANYIVLGVGPNIGASAMMFPDVSSLAVSGFTLTTRTYNASAADIVSYFQFQVFGF